MSRFELHYGCDWRLNPPVRAGRSVGVRVGRPLRGAARTVTARARSTADSGGPRLVPRSGITVSGFVGGWVAAGVKLDDDLVWV